VCVSVLGWGKESDGAEFPCVCVCVCVLGWGKESDGAQSFPLCVCGLESDVCQVFVPQGVRPLTCVSMCILGKSQPHPCPGTHTPSMHQVMERVGGRDQNCQKGR